MSCIFLYYFKATWQLYVKKNRISFVPYSKEYYIFFVMLIFYYIVEWHNDWISQRINRMRYLSWSLRYWIRINSTKEKKKECQVSHYHDNYVKESCQLPFVLKNLFIQFCFILSSNNCLWSNIRFFLRKKNCTDCRQKSNFLFLTVVLIGNYLYTNKLYKENFLWTARRFEGFFKA